MMFEGKHIHFSPLNKKPLCSYSAKLCKQRRINGYAFCIRHILEDKSAPFKQCAHVARYNKQKCTNPIPSNENREFCNSHMQVAGILPKKERKIKKEKEKEVLSGEGKLKFADRLKALLTKENSVSCSEDTFNSDDPYAFPDTISENENGCVGFSATPILRNAWNCSQKSSPDVSSVDSPSRYEQSSKNSPVTDNSKLKSNIPTLSKTVNRLHAKIAQNKLLDKQKKTQDASQSTITILSAQYPSINDVKQNSMSPMEVNSIHSESDEAKVMSEFNKSEIAVKIEPVEDQGRSEDSIVSNCVSSPIAPSVIQADSRLSAEINSCSSEKFCEREKSPTPSDVSSKDKSLFDKVKLEKADTLENNRIPIVLRKLQRLMNNRKKKKKYVFPSGLYSSESESSDSEEESRLYSQLSRICVWDRSSSSLQDGKSEPRTSQRTQLKTELLRSYYQLCRLHSLQKQERERLQKTLPPLIEATRAYPNQTTELLMNLSKVPVKQKKIEKPILTAKKTCCYKKENFTCSNPALPYTWHCKKHIMYNVDQLLYEHCTAKFSDNTQCCVPVFDVCHELPLCFEHAKKRDNYNKMASEPKPKKPRKKPKPSALTRPPKRGKKKKKPNSVRPSSPPLPPPPTLPSDSQLPNSHIELPNVNSYATGTMKPVGTVVAVSDISKDLNGAMHTELGSDLEDFSPGAIEKTLELPLDTAELANQATKLLEEHDFTEVLNKIPDDAFNDLFVDTRNGEYIPTREETEELERALAAVSKDVHLARESLAKLSSASTGPDLEELERTIEIHGSLLGAENLTSAIDENSFADLPNNHMDTLNVISSSFSTSDLNSFTQALSEMTPDTLELSSIPPATESSLISNSINLPLSTAELSHSQILNGHSEILAGLHPLQLDPVYSNSLLNSSLSVSAPNQVTADGSKLFTNGSLLSTMFYNIGQVSSTPSQAFALSGNSDEAGGLGGLTNSTNHWLLNSPDVLAQLAYQNGYLVASQGNNAAFAAEPMSLASDSPLMPQTSCNSESVIMEQPIHISNGPASSLQQTSAVKVIVQEGAS